MQNNPFSSVSDPQLLHHTLWTPLYNRLTDRILDSSTYWVNSPKDLSKECREHPSVVFETFVVIDKQTTKECCLETGTQLNPSFGIPNTRVHQVATPARYCKSPVELLSVHFMEGVPVSIPTVNHSYRPGPIQVCLEQQHQSCHPECLSTGPYSGQRHLELPLWYYIPIGTSSQCSLTAWCKATAPDVSCLCSGNLNKGPISLGQGFATQRTILCTGACL